MGCCEKDKETIHQIYKNKLHEMWKEGPSEFPAVFKQMVEFFTLLCSKIETCLEAASYGITTKGFTYSLVFEKFKYIDMSVFSYANTSNDHYAGELTGGLIHSVEYKVNSNQLFITFIDPVMANKSYKVVNLDIKKNTSLADKVGSGGRIQKSKVTAMPRLLTYLACDKKLLTSLKLIVNPENLHNAFNPWRFNEQTSKALTHLSELFESIKGSLDSPVEINIKACDDNELHFGAKVPLMNRITQLSASHLLAAQEYLQRINILYDIENKVFVCKLIGDFAKNS
jgi:hypothetical protein